MNRKPVNSDKICITDSAFSQSNFHHCGDGRRTFHYWPSTSLNISARRAGKPKLPLTLAAVQQLQQYDWPGNVRELQHVIERAIITSTGSRLNIELPVSNQDQASN